MKVYGYDDTGIWRGEMFAAEVRPIDLDFGEKLLASELGWEYCTTRFANAQKQLVAEMEQAGTDQELIKTVRQLKASWVPVLTEV